MIHVIATVEVESGKRDEFLAAFRQVVPLVRGEDGCIDYGPAIEIETSLPVQEPVRPDAVMVIEKWRDLPALEAHLIAPHMNAYRKRVKPLVKRTSLRVLESASD